MNNFVKMPEVESSPVLENCSFAGRLNIILNWNLAVSIADGKEDIESWITFRETTFPRHISRLKIWSKKRGGFRKYVLRLYQCPVTLVNKN